MSSSLHSYSWQKFSYSIFLAYSLLVVIDYTHSDEMNAKNFKFQSFIKEKKKISDVDDDGGGGDGGDEF